MKQIHFPVGKLKSIYIIYIFSIPSHDLPLCQLSSKSIQLHDELTNQFINTHFRYIKLEYIYLGKCQRSLAIVTC